MPRHLLVDLLPEEPLLKELQLFVQLSLRRLFLPRHLLVDLLRGEPLPKELQLSVRLCPRHQFSLHQFLPRHLLAVHLLDEVPLKLHRHQFFLCQYPFAPLPQHQLLRHLLAAHLLEEVPLNLHRRQLVHPHSLHLWLMLLEAHVQHLLSFKLLPLPEHRQLHLSWELWGT